MPNLQFGKSVRFPGIRDIAKLQVWHSGMTDICFKSIKQKKGAVRCLNKYHPDFFGLLPVYLPVIFGWLMHMAYFFIRRDDDMVTIENIR
ncbi:Uncharacterized protein dnm_011310 [Desulfonema magnum]|uniref:Uncharacterized protein n=1 Tax=Desulfonema magnum TaxID=45655 RepID=A0A975BGS1_9BACT|nr:Uncharacterized protein dnm_011310 [Desulfonema magnum]